jgi:hypothetical protein
MIADIHRGLGRPGEALDHYQPALHLARQIGDLYEEAKILEGIAESTLYTQRRDAARIVFRQALDIFERLGVPEAESARTRIDAIDPLAAQASKSLSPSPPFALPPTGCALRRGPDQIRLLCHGLLPATSRRQDGRHARREIIRTSTDLDGTERTPLRAAEARLTLGVVAARQGEGHRGSRTPRSTRAHRAAQVRTVVDSGVRDLTRVLKERFANEAATARYLEQLQMLSMAADLSRPSHMQSNG